MESGIFRAGEAFAHCEAIVEKPTRDVVRHGLIAATSLLTRLDVATASTIAVDLLMFSRLLEIIASPPRELAALAGGAPFAPPTPLEALVARAEARGLVFHGGDALVRLAALADPRTRALVAFGLLRSLDGLSTVPDADIVSPGPLDLRLHETMLEAVFRAAHTVESLAAGNPEEPWIE